MSGVKRCVICGKQLVDGDMIAQIQTGKLVGGLPDATEEWGVAHRSCFNRALPAPKAALEEIRKLVKAAKTK